MTAAELIGTLVLRCRLDAEYVLDRMELYEIELWMSQLNCTYSDSWEQTRLLSYMIANNNPFRKKELPMTDIMRFPWDGEDSGRKELSEQELARLRDKAREFEEYVRNRNNGQ